MTDFTKRELIKLVNDILSEEIISDKPDLKYIKDLLEDRNNINEEIITVSVYELMKENYSYFYEELQALLDMQNSRTDDEISRIDVLEHICIDIDTLNKTDITKER